MMNAYNRNTALILAFLTVPFGVAIYQDATGKTPSHDPFGSDGLGMYDDYDDYDYEDYDEFDYDEFDENYGNGGLTPEQMDLLLAELEAEEDWDTEDDERETMGADFFDKMIFDRGKATAPVLADSLGKLRFGEKIDPQLDKHSDLDDMIVEGVPGFESARLSLQPDYTGALNAVGLYFPDDGSALKSLSAQWGAPAVTGDEGGSYWFNPKKKLAAVLSQPDYAGDVTIFYTRYQSLEDFVSPKKKLFSFESKDVIGVAEDDLPTEVRAEGYLEQAVPFIKGAHLGQSVSYELGIEGTVEEISFDIALEQGADEFIPLLRKKMGKPQSTNEDDYASVYVFKDKLGRSVEVTKSSYSDEFAVTIHRSRDQ